MARIEWLLEQRVQRQAAREHRPEKSERDLRLRVLKRLERIAFGDIRQVATWDKRAVTDSEGNVTELRNFVTLVPSRNLTHEAAATVKAVFSKSGELRLELHDPQPALEKLCKALGLYADATPRAPPVTVNQLNVGAMDAGETMKRIAFMIAAAQAQAAKAAPITIESKRADKQAPSESKIESKTALQHGENRK